MTNIVSYEELMQNLKSVDSGLAYHANCQIRGYGFDSLSMFGIDKEELKVENVSHVTIVIMTADGGCSHCIEMIKVKGHWYGTYEKYEK